MKKTLLITATLILAFAFTTRSQGNVTGNLSWLLQEKTLLIWGTGQMLNYSSSDKPWHSDKDSIETVNIIKGVSSIGRYAFHSCFNLSSVEIPVGITSIGDNAFCNCNRLTAVKIPDGVTRIGRGAFSACYQLTSVEIPASVTYIGFSAFNSCVGLTAITVDADNNHYSSIDGVLFNKAQDTLINCPPTKTGNYTIPDGVTHIESNAFSNSKLSSINIPDGVTSIGDGAFSSCHNLTSIEIPASVNDIGSLFLLWCSNLKEIILNGIPQTMPPDAFNNINDSDINLIVPMDLINTSEDKTMWKDFNISGFYNIEVTVNNENYGTTAGSGSYFQDSTATVTALANEGYVFANWTIDGKEVSTDAVYNFTVTKNVELVGNFVGTNTKLQSLTIIENGLSPMFNPEVVEYMVIVDYETEEIVIDAVPEDENATVNGTGEKPLVVGENVFDIIVTAEDGETTQTYKVVVIRTEYVGIDELTADNEQLIVFPNPTSGIINIISDDDVIKNISVYTINGVLVKTSGTFLQTNKTTSVNIAELPNGIYLLKIETDKGSLVRKVIKE
ncbi:leucine-rich repeat protein [Bacteroidales bacterium OttesenSCG-928-C19]|nr:leucine-rich repeat protein [Bacteroidales bacterium OttesenSCG-928-C19]